MEYLDYYDEDGNYLGFKTRDEVHKEGLWHNTVHCWLYEMDGSVYFQIRSSSHKFYTTASGHVLKGETIQKAFRREIKEEIGLNIDSSDATLVDIIPWRMDKMKNGSLFIDRARANVYVDLFEGNIDNFKFNPNEVLGVVKVKAKNALELFKKGKGEIPAIIITTKDNKNIRENRMVTIDDFLVMKDENAYDKYKDVLNKIIEITK